MANNATISGIVTTSPKMHRTAIGSCLMFEIMSRDSMGRPSYCAIVANGEETVLTEVCSRVGSGSRIKLVGELSGPRGRNYLRVSLPDGLVALKTKKQETAT